MQKYKLISILVDGSNSCNFRCKYCCIKDSLGSDYINIDYPKLKDKINSIKNGDVEQFVLWGGELFKENKIKILKELVDFLNENYPTASIYIPTNGKYISTAPREKIEWLFDTNKKIILQLSHDGVKHTKLRNKFNPLDYDIWKTLANIGVFQSINTVLNNKNFSFIRNMIYFNHKLKDIPLVTVRLWHLLESDKDDPIYQLKGIKLFIHLLELYMIIVYTIKHPKKLNKFSSGILSYLTINSVYELPCYNYHMGFSKTNNAITTMGEFSDCQNTKKIDNPLSLRPEYCMVCKYFDSPYCVPCGANFLPKKCRYKKGINKIYYRIREKYKKDIANFIEEVKNDRKSFKL